MSDKILITGVRASGKHGVLEPEQLIAQEFVVDAEMKLDLSEASRNDDLTKTVDYETVAILIHRIVTTTSYALIEALAGRIADEILALDSSINEAIVTVHKPTAPISVPFGDVAVTIKRHR